MLQARLAFSRQKWSASNSQKADRWILGIANR
jgi:hypothetical protein